MGCTTNLMCQKCEWQFHLDRVEDTISRGGISLIEMVNLQSFVSVIREKKHLTPAVKRNLEKVLGSIKG